MPMKRSVFCMLAVLPLLAGAVLLLRSRPEPPERIPVQTEEERTAWLRAQSWEPLSCTEQEVTVPQQMTGVYAGYAALQTYQHLPLPEYSGQRGVLYTYVLKDTQLCAELLAADGILIGAQCYLPEESVTLDMKGNPFSYPDADNLT